MALGFSQLGRSLESVRTALMDTTTKVLKRGYACTLPHEIQLLISLALAGWSIDLEVQILSPASGDSRLHNTTLYVSTILHLALLTVTTLTARYLAPSSLLPSADTILILTYTGITNEGRSPGW